MITNIENFFKKMKERYPAFKFTGTFNPKEKSYEIDIGLDAIGKVMINEKIFLRNNYLEKIGKMIIDKIIVDLEYLLSILKKDIGKTVEEIMETEGNEYKNSFSDPSILDDHFPDFNDF